MTTLDLKDVLIFAITLERRGLDFFTEWAEKAESDEVKMFFSMLADEENEHVEIFTKILEKQKKEVKQTELSVKFLDFFKTFSEDIMFSNEDFKKVRNLSEAFELAKKQEIDVQLFYSELKKHVDKSKAGIIGELIKEEQEHYKKINDLQKKLRPN